jgi:hypothetical protein
MRPNVSHGSLFLALLSLGAATACSGAAPVGEAVDHSAEGISADDTGSLPTPKPPAIGSPGRAYTVPDCPPGQLGYQAQIEVWHEPGTGDPYNVCVMSPSTSCEWLLAPVSTSCQDEVPAASWPPIGAPNITAIALGAHTTYALGVAPFAEASDTRAAVYSWGLNSDYELGNGTTTSSSIAVTTLWVQGNAVTAIAAGDEDACARMNDGSVRCWGTIATLPSPVVEKTPTRIAFPSGTTISQIAHGEDHACALATGGAAVYCWGNNDKQQLGDLTSSAGRVTPFKVPLNIGTRLIVAIAAGGKASCALDNKGFAWCWGDNERGSLGNGGGGATGGTTSYAGIPQQVASPTDAFGALTTFATYASAGNPPLVGGGAGTFCAQAVGALFGGLNGWFCWGANDQGQAGLVAEGVPLSVDEMAPMLTRPEISQAPSLTLGVNHSCAGGVSGPNTAVLTCFGANQDGQLGIGSTSTTPLYAPQTVITSQLYDNPSGLLPTFAVGANHSCALLPASAFEQEPNLVCWGAYESGELSMPLWTKSAAGAWVAPTASEPSYMAWVYGSLGQWGE